MPDVTDANSGNVATSNIRNAHPKCNFRGLTPEEYWCKNPIPEHGGGGARSCSRWYPWTDADERDPDPYYAKRVCRWCGRAFKVNHIGSTARYCCYRCSNDASIERQLQRRIWNRKKTCLQCDKNFVATRGDALYCSDACKQARYRTLKKRAIQDAIDKAKREKYLMEYWDAKCSVCHVRFVDRADPDCEMLHNCTWPGGGAYVDLDELG